MASYSNDKHVQIVHCDICEDMKVRAIEFTLAQEKTQQKDAETLAKNIKRDFDLKFHPTW